MTAGPTPRDVGSTIVSLLLAMALAIASLALAASPSRAGPQQAPNSRVVLDLPAGYQPASLFSGFQSDEFGVSYVILEAPLKAYDEMAAGFAPAELAKRGLTDAEKGTLSRAGDYVYMRARQKSPAGAYAKFFVLFRTADQTVLISSNVPEAALGDGSVAAKDVETVLASARTVELTAVRDLYRLGYLGPFREAVRFAGTSRIYTLDGRVGADPQDAAARPVLMVSPSLDKRPVTNAGDLAGKLMTSLSGYRDVRTAPPRTLQIAAIPAVETIADAVDSQTGAAVRIYQMLICPADGGYFRVLGFAPAAGAPALEPEFRRIAETFALDQ